MAKGWKNESERHKLASSGIRTTEEISKMEAERFKSAMLPWGYNDVKTAIDTALSAGKDGDWVSEQVQQYIDDTGTKLEEVDVCAIVYDSLLQEARNDISSSTDIDILNDLSGDVYVYGNYMCTSLDANGNGVEETMKAIKKIPKEDRTDAINWLYDKIKDMG